MPNCMSVSIESYRHESNPGHMIQRALDQFLRLKTHKTENKNSSSEFFHLIL